MALEAGKMLSHYRLVEKIGEGGMGVVWKALDTSLDREVAIKALPEIVSQSADRLARMDREAKLLASLNHPNIAMIHGLHEADGVRFLAMELVAGEDLAQRLARGPLPVDEALRITHQVAEALEAAHDRGVVHRDLKPANVKLAHDGQVKVLDFGLAKAFDTDSSQSSSGLSVSPTMTSGGTLVGAIIGTAAYMSPEQAKGKPVDRRADIWAFGCLLYEMLTGRRLFEGETISETLAAVLLKDPDFGALPPATPLRIQSLLRRCLTRDPKSRMRDMGEARIAIDGAIRGVEDAEAPSPAPAASAAASSLSRRHFAAIAVLVVATAAAGLLAGRGLRPAATAMPLRKFALPFEETSRWIDPRISPDGKRVVFEVAGRLRVRDLDQLDTRELAGTDDAETPCWSPDGAWIAYGARKKLWKIAATGGQPAALCELPGGTWSGAAGCAWEPDGRIVFTTGSSGLLSVAAEGGDPVPLLDIDPKSDTDFHDAAPLPNGRGTLFVVHRKTQTGGGFDTIAAFAGGKRRELLRMEGQDLSDPVYSPTGHLLFSRRPGNPGIWAVPFSLAKLATTGEPFLAVPNGSQPSVAGDGTLVFLPRRLSRILQLGWLDNDGRPAGTVGQIEEQAVSPVLSPDGNHVAVLAGGDRKFDLWVYDLVRGTKTRLTFSENAAGTPAWSPSGKELAFVTGTNITNFATHIVAADGTDKPRDLASGFNPSFTPDGRTLLFAGRDNSAKDPSIDIMALPLEGDPVPRHVINTQADEVWAQVSPDGRYIAYVSEESGHWEVFIKPFPQGEGKWQVSTAGGQWPRWSPSGRKLLYTAGLDFYEVEVAERPSLTLGNPRKLFSRPPLGWSLNRGFLPGFTFTGEGERFLIAQGIKQDITGEGIAVVQNWASEFQKGR